MHYTSLYLSEFKSPLYHVSWWLRWTFKCIAIGLSICRSRWSWPPIAPMSWIQHYSGQVVWIVKLRFHSQMSKEGLRFWRSMLQESQSMARSTMRLLSNLQRYSMLDYSYDIVIVHCYCSFCFFDQIIRVLLITNSNNQVCFISLDGSLLFWPLKY